MPAAPETYELQWESGAHIIVRGLSWGDYKRLAAKAAKSPFSAYCELYDLVRIHGPAVNDVSAGCVSALGKLFLDSNPFNGSVKSIQKALVRVREDNKAFLEQARSIVAHTFQYSFEDIDKWDADTFFDRLAKAEVVLGRNLEMVMPTLEGKSSVDPSASPKQYNTPADQRRQDQRAKMQRKITARDRPR